MALMFGNTQINSLEAISNWSKIVKFVNSTVKYSFATVTSKLLDRTSNEVKVTDQLVTLDFPDRSEAGKTRDFLVFIDAEEFTTGGALEINIPAGSRMYGDEFPAITEAGRFLISITEIATDIFYTRTIKLEEVMTQDPEQA